LFAVQELPHFLADAACPVDLSHLTEFKFCFRLSSGIETLLHNSRHTIQSLDFEGSGTSPLSIYTKAYL
jgi:hypothetical protein